MEEYMTDYQLKTILKMIKDIIDNSYNIEEAREKIGNLIREN